MHKNLINLIKFSSKRNNSFKNLRGKKIYTFFCKQHHKLGKIPQLFSTPQKNTRTLKYSEDNQGFKKNFNKTTLVKLKNKVSTSLK